MLERIKTSINYRSEIDGLRAIAVLAVLFYHLGWPIFSGGFVGVDVFFVISGYLITSIIIKDLDKGTFSLANFWYRRVKRIIPVLFVILSIVSIAAFFILIFEDDLIDYGQSLFAQSIFLSNIFFIRSHNYFAQGVDALPLLHTWTLSVEEQFYIFLPVLFILIAKLSSRRRKIIIVSVAVISLVYSILLTNVFPGYKFSLPFIPDIWYATNQTASFYLILTRAWELLLGSIVAVLALSISRQKVSQWIGFVGLLMIFYAVFFFGHNTSFPGLNALIPTLGTALIIVSNRNSQNIVGKILSWKPFIWIGLISYSLYLWHWPLIVFAQMYFFEGLNIWHHLGIIVLSFGLSYLTYRFVEIPFRKYDFGYKKAFILGALALVILASVGFWFGNFYKYKNISPEAQRILEAKYEFGPRRDSCLTEKDFNDLEKDGPCILGNEESDNDIDFLVWGDSHAGFLLPIFDDLSKEYGVKGAFVAASGFVPILNVKKNEVDDQCQKIKDYTISYIEDNNIDKVVLASRWNSYIKIVDEKGEDTSSLLIDSKTVEFSEEDAKRVMEENLINMVNDFNQKGISTYFFKEVPFYRNIDFRKEIRRANETNTIYFESVSLDEHLRYNSFVNNLIDNLSKLPSVYSIDPTSILCQGNGEVVCNMEREGQILYSDNNHLNLSGAMKLKPLFRDFFVGL